MIDLSDVGAQCFHSVNVRIQSKRYVNWEYSVITLFMKVISRATFTKHELTMISAWMNNHVSNKLWNEIIYIFPNFYGAPIVV